MAVVPSEFDLVPVTSLREHEEIVSVDTVRALVDRIRRDGHMYQPIVADKRTLVVLDGHHRLSALRLLGVRLAPVNLVDYRDARIRVECWQADLPAPDKEDVIARALAGKPYPPKTTRHPDLYDLPQRRVALPDLS